jgi:hypothetical protein
VGQDAAADGTPETAAFLERLYAYEGVPSVLKARPVETAMNPVVPMHFRKNETDLRLFTTIVTLGIPQDITLQELRIECFFPVDEDTASTFRAWASKTT